MARKIEEETAARYKKETGETLEQALFRILNEQETMLKAAIEMRVTPQTINAWCIKYGITPGKKTWVRIRKHTAGGNGMAAR